MTLVHSVSDPIPCRSQRAADFSGGTSVRKLSDFAHPCPYFLLGVAFPEYSP